MQELHFDLSLACPRCGSQLVLRALAEERGGAVRVTLDSACVACGGAPWDAPDARTLEFTPGTPPPPDEARAHAAQALIETLQRRCEALQAALGAAQRGEERARQAAGDAALRSEISRLEGALAAARAEVRRAEEATRGETSAGIRPIELE